VCAEYLPLAGWKDAAFGGQFVRIKSVAAGADGRIGTWEQSNTEKFFGKWISPENAEVLFGVLRLNVMRFYATSSMTNVEFCIKMSL